MYQIGIENILNNKNNNRVVNIGVVRNSFTN